MQNLGKLHNYKFTLMQPVFTCLKLTIETPEQCVKSVQC